MANVNQPAVSNFTRVFLTKYGARADRSPVYYNCMKIGTVEESAGDITSVYCPDPDQAGAFLERAQIKGEPERPTSQLVGRYPANEASTLKKMFDQGCAFDYYTPFGECRNPSQFGALHDKMNIYEDVSITNYATDELGALAPGDSAEVNETADLSLKRWYEVLNLGLTTQAGDLVTNAILDTVICDSKSCGDCADPSGGCEKVFWLTTAAGGSPGTPPDVLYLFNGSYYAVDIDTMLTAEVPSAFACVGSYLVVISNENNALHYALLTDFDSDPAVTWTKVATGFVAGGEPNDIWSVGNTAFIVGDGGYIYKLTDPTAGVTVISAGATTTNDLQGIHAVDDAKFVAVGENGAIILCENADAANPSMSSITSPVGVGITLNCIWIKSNNSNEWFFGSDAGNLYYTVDNGVSNAIRTFSGSAAGVVYDVAFASKNVGYLAHAKATPAGRIFRTRDGGYTWELLPEGAASIPANDYISSLAACVEDVNFLAAGGLADNGTDGIILLGED